MDREDSGQFQQRFVPAEVDEGGLARERDFGGGGGSDGVVMVAAAVWPVFPFGSSFHR